jgi:hypothetical protein
MRRFDEAPAGAGALPYEGASFPCVRVERCSFKIGLFGEMASFRRPIPPKPTCEASD